MSKNEKNNKRKSKKEDKRKTRNSNSPSSPSSPTRSPALSLPLPAHPSQIANWKEEKKRRKAEQKALRKHQKEQLIKQKRSTCCCCCLCCLPSGGKKGQWNSDDELNEAEQQMQKKTFTNWVNFRLEEHSSSGRVTDLFIDMRDGVLLCRLLEVLTGQVLLVTTESAVVALSKNGQSNGKVQRRHSSGGISSKQRVHHLANLSAALKCLRENGLQLLGNSATDLADGNPHVWLGLVWQIILHFQVEQNLSLLRQSVWHQIHQQQAEQKCHLFALPGTSNGGGTAAIVTRTADGLPKEGIERQLIKWVTDEVIGDLGLRVRDFDRSWCDGRLFCALVHRFAPALMSRGEVLGGGNDVQSAQRRTERAMEVARLHLGIRPLLEARDVTVSEYVPDKRSLIAYVSQFVCLRPHQMMSHSLVQISSAVPADVSVVVEQCQQKKEMEEEKFFVFKEWLHWLHSVAADERLKLVARQRITIRHFIWFTQMREEFWERRAAIVDHLLVAIRKSASEEAEGEKTARQIEDEMEQLECAIGDWECHLCTYFPDSHSAQLVPLSDWISSGERLLSSSEYNGIDQLLNAGQVGETLRRLEAAIGRLEQFFRILADQRALLYELEHQIGSVSPFDSLSADLLLQPMHLLGDFRRRFDALSEKQRNAMAQMLFEQCRFRVLEKLGILKSKIRIWKTQLNGEQQTRQTLDEWTEFATKEKPNEMCEHLLSSLQNAIPTPSPNQSAHYYELRNWSLRVHNQLTKEFRREIGRFFEFGNILEELANFWTKFEMADKQMQNQTLAKDKWTEKMNECEELAAKIGTIGAELTEMAADEAKKRIKAIGKRRKMKTKEEEVQQGKQLEEVTNQNQFEGVENRGNAEPSENGTEAKRNTAFWKWQMIGEELARKRPKDEEEVINLIDWLQDLGKDFPTAEASLNRWAAQSPPIVGTNEKQSQIARFGAVHRRFLDQLETLDSFKGRFIHLEKVLTDLEQWTIHHDPDSEMATKSVGERAERIQWATKELAELTSFCAQTFDFSSLAELDRRIRSSFTNFTQPNEFEDQIGHQLACQSIATDLAHLQIAIPSTSNVFAAIELHELSVVEAAEDVTLERISSLKSRLAKVDLDTAQTGPSSTQKVDLWALLKKKRTILARDESSEEEARASLREMALIDDELGDELKGNAEFEKLSRQWTSKKAELDRLMILNDQLKRICGRLDEGQGEEANAEELETELDALARSLATTALAHSDNGTSAAAFPLHRQFIRRVETIKKRIHRRMAEEQRQQRHALMHKIEALKMSPEGDLPVALEVAEEVLQEAAALVQRNISSSDQQIAEDSDAGAEQYTDHSSHPFPLPPPHFSSAESLRLISEAQQLQKVLCMKMELLNRLERLERTLEEIERDNGGWDVILSGQVEAVLGVLANWLKQLNDQLAPEQSQLDTLFAQNGDNFIQIESERMGRRMDTVREKISELKTVMEHRQMFLIKMCAFKALFEKCMEKAQGEKQIKGKETKKTQLELNALKTQILGAVPELFEAQTNARISVPDIDLQRMLDQILGDSIGPSTSPLPPPLSSRANELMNSFMTLASQLHNSLDLSLESFQFGTFSPSQFADRISQSVASEEASLNELLRLSVSISSLVSPPQTDAAADTLQMLKERLHKRHKEHQIRIEEMSARCLRAFRDRLASLEAQLESAIQKREAERLNGLERKEYSELRKELDQFDKTLAKSANGTDQKAHWPRKWAKRFQQLHNNLNIFGNNLANAKIAIGAREERKELKLVHHLSAFGKWLDLIEHEMLQLHSPDQSADPFESDRSERRVKLTKLRDNCVQHFRLVVKLQTHQFASEEQAEQAHTLCQQYRKVMEQFEKMRLPISHLIPVKKAEETHDGKGDNKSGGGITERAQSQLSLDSSTPSDLDSDLASLHSEVLVAEALSHRLSSDFPCSSSTAASSPTAAAAPVENVLPSIGLVRQIAAKTTKSDVKSDELPMEEMENEVQQLLLAIDHMHTRYYTPKPLDEAQSDASSLKLLAKRLTELKMDLKTVAAIASVDEHKKHLQKLSSNLKREKNGLKRFHRELADEIEAEIALRTNYAQTAEHLAQLDAEVRSAAAEGRVPQTEAMLRRIELQMEMLKKQCRATRKFVEMSVDGAASTSPTRRRRIIFRLSNTVTTIIQVIESKLRQGEAEAKKGGSGRETMSESEAEELTKLHQKLTALKRETEETEMEEKAEERAKKQMEEKRTETHTELTELEHGKQKQSDEREEQEDQSDFLVQAEQMVEKSEMVRMKLEELIGAEGELPESGQQQSPLIRKVRSELNKLLTELEKGDKKGQQKNQAMGKCEAKLAKLIRAFDELDSKYNEKLEKQKVIRQKLEGHKRRMDKVIGDGEKLLKDPEASIEQFQAAIDTFEAVGSEIAAEIQQQDTPVFVSNELIKGLKQMKPIKERMEREYSLANDTKMALEEGAEVMKRLREERSKLDTFTKLGEEAEGIVKTMTILGQKLKVTAEKLRALDVELPIRSDIDKHLAIIDEVEKEMAKERNKRAMEEEEKLGKWPEKVTEVNMEVFLTRTEAEEVEDESVKKVIMNISKRREWDKEETDQQREGKAIGETEEKPKEERTALLNTANELDEQVQQAHAFEEPQEQISELDKLHNQLEQVEQQMRTVDQQSEQYPTPQKATTLGEQIAHVVHKTRTNIEDARHQLEERIAQNARKEQLRDRAVRLDDSLTALVNQAHDKLNESAAMPQCYEQLCNGLAEQIELAEQFGAENGITVGEERIAQAKEVREQLAQRWHHWGEFVRLRDLGTAQLDKARVAIDQTEQKTCRSVAEAESDHDNLLEAQGSLTSLNATIDQLQQLADKLDPLATTHAEVRFLDVEFEQLEKHFGDVLDQMHNEIEQEKALMAETERAGRETDEMTAQLPTMANNLKALQHAQQTAIPALEAKVVMLQQQSEKEKPLRQYVLRSTAAPSPDELAQRLALSKGRAQEAAQQLVDTAVVRVQNVLLGTSQAAAELPSDEQIDECAKELQDNIPLEHPHNEQLRQQLEQLREKVMRRDAIRSQIDQHLATIGKELEGFSEQFISSSTTNGKKVPPSSKKEAKKKKGKGGEPEQQKRAEKMASREEHIDELRKALGRLESGILPALNTLHDEAVQQGIPLQPTEEHQHQLMRANQIVQSLKEDLDKSVAENERASVIINDIRLLKSIVDGTVVEAETAAEEATLQLLDVQSVEQHKRDMEEAAKKLGEQLAKMAADAHEVSTSLEPEEQALMKRVEEEAGKKMDRLNSLNSVLQQQMEVLRDWARDKDRLEQHTCSLIDQLKRVQEEREEAGPAPAEQELAKLDALQSEVDEARDEMKRMQSWLVQKLPKCGRAAVELQLRPVEESLVKLNTDMDGTMEQLKKNVQIERRLLEERTALLNAANELDEQVQQAHAFEEPQEQISELDKLHNQLEQVEQQMRTVDQQSEQYPTPQKATTLGEQIAHVVHKTRTNIEDARHQLEERIAQNARKEQLRDRAVRLDDSLTALVNQAHDKLDESAAMPQCYEHLCNGLAEQIELAEQFGAENGITVGEERIAQAKEVREQLAQRWHHWGEFVRLRDLGTAQLDKHRNSLDNVRSAPLFSELNDAQLQLSSLKDNSLHFSQIRQLLSDLVSLSKSLSPLSVVDDILRFMFVELESLESANKQIVHQFEAEIEHGNELEQMFDGIASNVSTSENNFDHFLQLRNSDRMNDLLTELGEIGAQTDQLEQSIWQGNDQQRIFVQSFDKKRLQILRERIEQLEKNILGAFSELSEGPSMEAAEEQPKYDVDAAVEILSAIYPGREPLEVMREHGLDKLELDMNDDYGDGQTEGEEDDFLTELSPQPSRPSVSSKDSSISSVPDDPSHAAGAQQRPMAQLQQQQSRWRRVLRTALPLQAMLVLLLGAACLVPHCDDEYCCHLLNNFARSFDPQLHFANGPPPF